MAIPSLTDQPAQPAPEEPEVRPERRFGAIGTLRLLLLGTILLPLLLGAVAAYVSYRDAGERAAAALSEAVAVAEQNTAKVLDTHLLVAARIDDLLAPLSDEQVRAQEASLHDRIAQQIADLPQVAAAWVIEADGREVISARIYPVNRALDQSARDDFRALRDSGAKTFIWALRAKSLDGGDYRPYFTVSRRRDGANGQFGGVIVVAVSGAYFASFYDSLLGGPERYAANVLREDGTVLAHYPATAGAPPAEPDALLAAAIAGKAKSGVIASGSPFDASGRIVAFRRLANYPVYVTIERSRAAILREWLGSIAGYIIVGVPAAIALFVLSLLALRRTRREQAALAQARDAIAHRAAIESQLHQAQKLEAVGLLTAGIAHDFNNLVTIISGNISLLQSTLDGLDARRQKFLTAAANGCERAAALTKRLLAFSRPEPVDPRPIDVSEVVANTLELPWRSGDEITGEFRLARDVWPVFVDPHQLGSALLNLALNARDALSDGGRLTIETANCPLGDARAAREAGVPPGDYVAIFVSDTGHGMPEEIRSKAFDPFFTTKQPGKGTGLGLSQVYGFTTRSGGYCTINSEPGRGTTVRLYLPRHHSEPPANGADPSALNGPAMLLADGERAGAKPD